jgi:hypothetical protein
MRSRRVREYVFAFVIVEMGGVTLFLLTPWHSPGRPERWRICWNVIRSSRRRVGSPRNVPSFPKVLQMYRPDPVYQASWGRKSWVSIGTKPSFAAYVRIYLPFCHHDARITTQPTQQHLLHCITPHHTTSASCCGAFAAGCFVFGKHPLV